MSSNQSGANRIPPIAEEIGKGGGADAPSGDLDVKQSEINRKIQSDKSAVILEKNSTWILIVVFWAIAIVGIAIVFAILSVWAYHLLTSGDADKIENILMNGISAVIGGIVGHFIRNLRSGDR